MSVSPTDPLLKTYIFQVPIVTRHLVANFILVGLATTVVALRFVARRIRKTKVWWDDIAAVVSLIFTLGMLAMHITYANHGMRIHMAELPLANTTFIAKQLVAYQAVYYAAMSSVKISYLWFYLRIFPHPDFRKYIWMCMSLIIGYWLGSMLQIFLICTPFEMNWNPVIPGGHCASYNVAFVTIGIFNMITDLIIMLLPIPFIRKLQMAPGTKFGLVAIFAIGLFVTAITIIRINVLLNVDFTDLSYSMHDAAFWSVAEPAVAIINCCITTLRPLLKIVSPSRLWSSNKGSTVDRAGYGNSGNMDSRVKMRNKLGVEHDEYPLTCIEDGMGNSATAGRGDGDGSHDLKGDGSSDNSMRDTPSMHSGKTR
ncbi:integral membrane protein [Massarina eburnea CBS 473.64]|uniref:Integral membrane protein n=1 Tax=Massarina eburnea CBS 473.64 TaxID=1395130 RepID=A0A6A6SBG4_9PLEO|nr:integral membrane protein [Massarina eburnea CBS 473.64]